MNRREALRTIGTGTALTTLGAVIVVTTSCASTEAHAAEADPTLAAIEAHKAAWARWQTMEGDEPTWDDACKAELDAWEAVCEVHPTTMAGLVAMSGYIGRFCLSDLPPDGIAIHKAFSTIATAAARFAYVHGRT